MHECSLQWEDGAGSTAASGLGLWLSAGELNHKGK